MHAKLRKKQYSMANNQEKSQELIIFYKKNNILYLFLRNLGFFANFAGKVQYKYEAQYRYLHTGLPDDKRKVNERL